MAVQVMSERQIDLSKHRPKHLDEFLGEESIRIAIIVCDSANTTCPTWPGAEQRHFWPFDDPARATGSEQERLAVFRRVRDQIDQRVSDWLNEGT